MSYCTSLTGKHRYEPRYDETPIDFDFGDLPVQVRVGMSAKEARSFLFRRIYVCDVCRHCGDVIDRIDKETPP